MYTRTVTYEDFNGNTQTETLSFHLNTPEVVKWITSPKEESGLTLDQIIEKLYDEKDISKMMDLFEDIIVRSYGVKSEDGKRFVKNEQATKEFLESEAYNQFIMDMITEENVASDFINNIIPKSVLEKAIASLKENADAIPENLKPMYNDFITSSTV